MQASSKRAPNTVIPALPLTLNTKILDMTSFAPVESKQTISSHAPSLISIPTLLTMVLQQTESIMNPGQPQPLTSQIGQLPAPDGKVPSPDIEVSILVPESITISLEEISERIEINPNLDMA
ncbi:12682_t:CDS:2 [Gigaspora margarita]|uniref:12682_t:CDS:1 n=1 Tax=Gigaspora margarita TaxID=4874 RepID=A0ABN7V5N2_GIGMA|nr:12682_t:CDS:2 [Gigaspora margarita]